MIQRVKTIASVILVLASSSLALAQYGGGGGTGGGGTSGTGTYSPRSYGSKGAIIGGVVAGAAVGGGLLYWKLHNRSKLQGCVTAAGDKLVNEKDNQTYNLTNAQGGSVKPGERVQVVGKKRKTDSGDPSFEVVKFSKDLGSCKPTTAETLETATSR
jgi:hypothetical protein